MKLRRKLAELKTEFEQVTKLMRDVVNDVVKATQVDFA